MSNIGEANIPVEFDLAKLAPQINEIVGIVSQAVEKMKNLLHFKADGIDGEKVEETFNKIGHEAQEADKNIKGLGHAGKDAIRELLKFEVVKQAVESVREAFTRVKDYVLGFIESFAAADLAVNKLRGGLERIGQTGWFDRLMQQASQLSKITPFDDDDITNMQAMLTTFDGISANAVQKLTPAMLNLASAFAQGGDTGMNLTQVAILIGKSAGAELWSALKRVGIVMTETQQKMLETTSGMERINVFLEIMAQNGNITAEAFGKTLSGQLQIARNEIGNVAESLGEALAPAALFVIGHLKTFSENLQKLPDFAKIAIVAIGAIVIALSSLAAVLTVLNIETAGVLIAIGVFVTGLAALATIVIANIDKIKEWILSNEDTRKQIAALVNAFDSLSDTLSNLWDEISKIIGNGKTLADVISFLARTEITGLLAVLNLLVKVLDTVANTMIFAARGAGILKDAFVYAVGVIVSTVQSGFALVKNAVNSVLNLFSIPVPKVLTNSIAGVVDWALSKINALRKAIADLLGFNYDAPETVVPAMQGALIPDEKPPSPKTDKGSGKGEKKDEDPYKKETEALKKLMQEHEHYLKDIEKRIQLGELTPIALLEEIELYKKDLLALQGVLEKTENKREVDSKILDLRIQENKILNLNNDAVKDALALGKKIVDEDKKKFNEKMERESKAYDELKNKRIQNETDAYRKSIDSINAKWDAENRRIEQTYFDSNVKEQLLDENRKARMEELRQVEMNDTTSFLNWTIQGFNGVQSVIQSGFSNMWTSVFGQANSLLEVFVQKVFEAFIALAATAVFKLIMSVLNPAGAIIAAATPATFSTGGYTGLGAAGEIAGIVHKNEFVVSEKGVTPETMPLLQAMNRGEGISSFLRDTVRVPSVALPQVKIEQRTAGTVGKTNLTINLGGLQVATKSLTGIPKSELIELVDRELMPELSASLRRFGKKVLDNKFKK